MNGFSEKILHSAEEGIVLLKNQDSALPFISSDNIAVFGRIQFEFYRCGTGSGGSVHVPYMTNLTDSLCEIAKDRGFSVNSDLAKIYKDYISKNPFDNAGGAWAAEPWFQKDMEISSELASKIATTSNKAIYVVGRTAGEDKDYIAEKGSWYLTDVEMTNIKVLCQNFNDVIIIFNTSGIMDTAWINSDEFAGKIKAVVYAWQGGQEAGRACANVISGIVTPSGKLTDTIARNIQDYPSTSEFAKLKCIYREDIFVGYRYFNTFAKEKILYPFGFGLSYTNFELKNIECKSIAKKVFVTLDVQNTGSEFSGKEIVQAYISCPQGKLGKSAIELAAFEKTKLLAPGEVQNLTLEFNIEDFASYDDSGITGFEFCKVLEAGTYFVSVGTDSLSARKILVGGNEGIEIAETYSVEKLQQCAAPLTAFDRLVAKADDKGNLTEGFETVPLYKIDIAKRIKENLPSDIPFTGNKGISFEDVKKDEAKLDSFIAQLTPEELSTIVRGEGMLSRKVTRGIAAAFGGVSQSLHDYGIPCAGCADGPSGLRLDNGGEASLMPIGTQLACSWNLSLVKDLYEAEGKELVEHEIDALLGPGINIHRNPLNGRNFEYFSEDPLLAGLMAKVQIEGLKKGGSNGTVKHFALNSQETMRRTTESIVSERAIREIYLKPFEIAVKGRVLNSIMTSYNCINGHWAAGNYDIVNTILRKEWNYEGMVMTDWWANMNDCVEGGEPAVKNMSSMLRARGDIYMVVDNDGAEKNVYGDDILESLKNGKLTLGELQLCVKDILKFILQSPVSERPLKPLVSIDEYLPLENCETAESFAADQHFAPKENEEVYLKIKTEGIYSVCGLYCKYEDNLSQSASNILINGKPAVSFECRTTMGKPVFVNASQIKLYPGTYKIQLVHTKPGIELQDLSFTSNEYNPVTDGIYK
ncbi:MAG: glycoside hydrolase family 3 C-terminal domain-containing protein [Treponema sp.]|nr:glycoside hydrolase family 3 C-terminal domain-containing protein [Candidatus Treponema equifaecale]